MAGTYTGRLERLPDGTYGGELVDEWGWQIALRAVVIERDGKRFFELKGLQGPVPPALRIKMLDDPRGGGRA
jgi:hypothetical protein